MFKNYSNLNDETLVELLRENKSTSEKAFSVLWSKYSKKIMQYCFLNSKNKIDAEDLFQTTWIKFYEMAINDGPISNVRLYLFRIAYNLKLKKYGSNKLQYRSETWNLDDIEDSHSNFLEEYEKQDIIAQFHLALNDLDVISKEYLLLHWVAELSYSEMSVLLEESSDSIRMRCNRAMQKVINIINPPIKVKNNGKI